MAREEDDSAPEEAKAEGSIDEKAEAPEPAEPVVAPPSRRRDEPCKGWSSSAYRLLALGAAALVLFPLLAKSGIWDPYELDAADLARRIALRAMGAQGLELPNAVNSLPTLTDLKAGELGYTSMAVGFKLFGLHDFSGRLPLALWGLLGAMAVYELLARLIDKRAGLYAVIALVTMPLYFMQARTMLGDIVTMSAMAMAFSGLTGALFEERKERAGERVAWMVLGVIGLAAGYLSRGLLIGVATPALGVGLAYLALRGSGERTDVTLRDAVGAASLVVGLAALGLGIRAFLRATPDAPLARELGFMVLKKVPNEATFDLVVRQLGHALFPWSAFLPFALGRLLRAPVEAEPEAREREMGVRVALLTASAVAYGAFALIAPRVGQIPFTGVALLAGVAALVVFDFERGAPPSRALALGCAVLGAVLCADILHEPERALSAFVVDKPQFPKSFEQGHLRGMAVVLVFFAGLVGITWFERQPEVEEPGWLQRRVASYTEGSRELAAIWNGNLLFALVVVEAACIGLGGMLFVGKRVGWHAVEVLPKLFSDIGLNVWWAMPLGGSIVIPLLVMARDAFRVLVRTTRWPRARFTMVAALLGGGTLGLFYYPALAAQLSPKEAFESYASLRKPGEPLALLGVRSRSAAYYAGSEVESFTDPQRAYGWLRDKPGERRWLLLKADDLARVNALYRIDNGKNLPVLDGRSSQILLASNQLDGHPNESWLSTMVLDEPPRPSRPSNAMFEDQLESIGWDVVDKKGNVVQTVVPATSYHLRFYYRVLKVVTGNWKSFVHIDGSQRRFNGDHAVLDGKYPMNLWRPGDTVCDDLEFQLEPNFTPGDYTVYFGFFSGDTRFRVTRGPSHENRAVAGAITVR